MTLLETKKLTKNFGGLVAISDLTFSIVPGELLSIIGPNGAGKTTLFNLLTGIHRPTSGSVRLNGEDITGCAPHKASRMGIARTFQKTAVFKGHTALDNVMIGTLLHSKAGVFRALFRTASNSREEQRSLERARDILSFVGLAHQEGTLIEGLTEEAKKRLSIAIALATEPRLLLLDEPTGGVNMDEISRLMDLIQRIRDRGVTVCLIEHKMRMVMTMSDRIIVLNHGRKIAEGVPQEVANDAKVVTAYLGGTHAA